MTIKVTDNFLPIQEYKPIYNLITSDTFPWFISNFKVNEGDGILQLNHYFYNGITTQSPVLKILEPIYLKLKLLLLYELKQIVLLVKMKKYKRIFILMGVL